MALSAEWPQRIEEWKRCLRHYFYMPLAPLSLEGFFTREQLPYEEAMKRPFKSLALGTAWGAKWQYGWFRGRFTLPRAARGKRIVVFPGTWPEGLVFVNGKAVSAFSRQQQYATLTRHGVPGQGYEVAVEAYAGHGPTPVGEGPVPDGVATVPEPPACQQRLEAASYGIWNEEFYQAWLDLENLHQLREAIADKESLRVQEIDEGLKAFTNLWDPELPLARMAAGLKAGRARLKPLLTCGNGSSAPTLFAFGHAHLDVAWLWPLAETQRKAARTLATQLALAAEYPEYKFLHSQPQLFGYIKDLYPELYIRVKRSAAAGNIIAEGAWWVEADTNLSGGEALIRQALYGKRFLREEFGVESQLLWLPDAFGYSANLPQLLRGCGIRYFATAKISINYHGGEAFPYNTFWWEGIDGSRVLAHSMNDHNSETGPQHTIERWRGRVQKSGLSTRLMPFGWGDGGGGPTRDHLEFARRQRNLEGAPAVRLASPLAFFEDLERRAAVPSVYVGEIYFQAHRGTYTSQARIKKGNRQCELVLREAELWGVAARQLKSFKFSAAALAPQWRQLLLCQFHDILPGSSIRRVCEEAKQTHEAVAETAREWCDRACASLTDKRPGACTVFNSLSFERLALLSLPAGFNGACVAGGARLPVQAAEGQHWVEVAVPACGWITLEKDTVLKAQPAVTASRDCLENERLRLRFNRQGELVSIYDKDEDREIADGPCNCLRMYKDVPAVWDAWDIDLTYEANPVALETDAEFEVVTQGPLFACLRIRRRINNSLMVQEVRLRRASRRIDFRTTIAWREKHKLLKVCFPVAIHAHEALHEIQFGYVRRPNHRSRQYDLDRFEVCNHKWTALCEENRGCAVLNDCKYGVNVLGKSINLTLLRAPLAPDMEADRSTQSFTYAFYSWNAAFDKSDLVQQGYDLNVPARVTRGAAGTRSLFSVDAPNVVIETVKPAEDGSGDIVVRLYESKRMTTRCRFSVGLTVTRVVATDMLENGADKLALKNGQVQLDFKPFEIKTVRLSRRL